VREFCADEKTRKAQNRYRIRALALFNRAKQKKAKRCQVRHEKKNGAEMCLKTMIVIFGTERRANDAIR
jgi:hypothetical protein